jgi:hypothetical protein
MLSPTPDLSPDLSKTVYNATLHLWKAILWLHDKPMHKAFLLGARFVKPRRIVYCNPELLSMFKVIEAVRLKELALQSEAKSKLKAFKQKRTRKHNT